VGMPTSLIITCRGMVVHILADGAQPARIDLLHFHGGILKLFRALPFNFCVWKTIAMLTL